MTLPGGYVLPIAWVTYEFVFYEIRETDRDDFTFLEQIARDYLLRQMSSGTILQEKHELTMADDLCRISASYSCYESIGLSKDEELIYKDE